jgi:hypothetical protein
MTHTAKIVLVGLVGLIMGAVFAGRLLVEFDWNPSTTIKFGETLPEQVSYAEKLLGEVVVADAAGHDGKFFFSQAMDPFYLEPDVHAIYLDRPTYRAQRMLYPTIASLGGVLDPNSIAWGLIVVNVLAMGIGTALTARLAVAMGISPWVGLAFLFNPGMIVSMYIDSADIVAVGALMAAAFYAIRDRPLATAVALSISALSRETMLLGAIGLIVYWYVERKRVPKVLFIPFVAVGLWWLYVHWRLDDGLAQDTQAIGLPLQGFIEAARDWLTTPNSLPDALVGLVLLFASIAIAVRAVRTPTALGAAVAGFALLAVILSEPVWARYFDSARALTPVLTAYVLLTTARIKGVASPNLERPLLAGTTRQ